MSRRPADPMRALEQERAFLALAAALRKMTAALAELGRALGGAS